MAGADTSGSSMEELVQSKELIQEPEEQEEVMKHKGVLKKKVEELSKLKKSDKPRKRFRASAAGSSSPPRQPPPPGPTTHVHQLPDEVLEKIFALLSVKTITSVISVCQRWQEVIEDHYLNKKLVFKGSEVTTQEALRLICSAQSLKSLELIQRSDAVALLEAASVHCTNLLKLSVCSCEVRGFGLRHALEKVFQTCPRITDLGLQWLCIPNSRQFYQELSTALPDLRRLEVTYGGAADLQLYTLIVSCSRNKIEELKVWCNPCSEEHIAKMVQCWGHSLRVLELNADRMTRGALARLGGCSELRRLRLCWLRTSGDGLSGLAALSHLEEFFSSYSEHVTPENWCHFFSQSRSSHCLRKITLREWDKVDDGVLTSIAAFCPQLEELEVPSMNVTISGVREVLWCCRKLLSLDIHEMDLGVDRIVTELPQLAPQLRRIGIGYEAMNSVGEATLRSVQAQMPHLRIE